MSDKPIFRPGRIAVTTVPASKESLWPVQAWVGAFARCFRLDDAAVRRLELVVEEAFMSLLHTSFEIGRAHV